MSRWEMHSVKFTYVGRMYDKKRFRDLPNQLRLVEVAEYYNATGDIGGSNLLVCGSPGEVVNNPALGAGFDIKSTMPTTSNSIFERQRGVVWTMVVLSAKDQLRQRMAWALSQIFVVVKAAIVADDNSETFLSYYDIFVRNAFGNYRDILREICYSPMMAENLSYLQSKSHAYVRKTLSKLQFADENFAREIMQLFTLGMFSLNIDGTLKHDENDRRIMTYTNDHIMDFARVWTGFDYQRKRSNTEDFMSSGNRLDPMQINAEWRDPFPKGDLNGGYIGDRYPLCVDLPEKMFLRKGAIYRLLGSTNMPELMQGKPEFLDDPSIRTFELPAASELKSQLCRDAGQNCLSPTKTLVSVDYNLDCVGKECDVDTVRVVEVVPGLFYEYVRPPCVELAFYNNAKKLSKRARYSNDGTSCGNPLLPVAQEACCPRFTIDAVAGMNNMYDGERVKYVTAENRCDPEVLCDFLLIDRDIGAHKTGYHWTSDECKVQVKVNGNNAAIVYSMKAQTKVMHIDYDSLNFFPVHWEGDIPSKEENSCAGGACKELPQGGCKCDVIVSENAVFKAMPFSAKALLSLLSIGAIRPESFNDGTFFSEFDEGTGVNAHKMNGVIDVNTIFEVKDNFGVTYFLKNIQSTVNVKGAPGFSFRNPPHFMSLIPTETDVRDAQYETEAALDHYFYHENTAPFLATRFIQRFGISNPTPRYVTAVATAFSTGNYHSGGNNFGSGKYGDLAATIAAVVLHAETRTVVLDADPAHGSIREPLMKVISMMRNLDFVAATPSTLIEFQRMEESIGQMAHEFPTVFSFFLPEYIPSGPLNDASLVSPESMLLDMPKIIASMNGMFSLVKYGLNRVNNGFGVSSELQGELKYNPIGMSSKEIVDELATLLTAGRLSDGNRELIQKNYDNMDDSIQALSLAEQLIATSAEFHSTSLVRKNKKARETFKPIDGQGGSYKAVVYLMLSGGCDSFNMLVPHTCTPLRVNDTDLNAQYSEVREEVHLVKQSLLQINATGQPCEKFGLHPSLPILKQLYQDNDALFVANTGVMTKPVTKDTYGSETVTQLFAHNTMQREAKRVDPFDTYTGTGVLGRMRDILNHNSFKTNAISIDTSSVALVGEPGISNGASIISQNGISDFNQNPTANEMREMIENINNATAFDSGFFAETWSSKLHESLDSNERINAALAASETSVLFPNTQLGRKLAIVSRMIQTADVRGVSRDMFYVEIGGFDTHSQVEVLLADRFMEINGALTAFVEELKGQGIWENVVLIETSDFARTLTPNSGHGTDHAWGGNYFIIGGDVNGGNILGHYPEDIRTDGPYNIGRGRLIPTTSW